MVKATNMKGRERRRGAVYAQDQELNLPRWQRLLLEWYDRTARDLPWRRTLDIYRIWVSEIMLQQTQVETVIPYYERFVEAFPNVFRLAAAEEDRVLKLWAGLGYYSRARNLHWAAKVIVAERKGAFPENAADWRRLPGVGRYSAGAIASIALGESTPVLDGNVKRVLARWFGITEDIDHAHTTKRMWELAGTLVPAKRPGDFNQALMELGARVCRPKGFRCEDCPLRKLCTAAAAGTQDRLPVRKRKPAGPHYQVAAAVIRRNGRILIGKRPSRGLLGGLWEFPGGKIHKGETYPEALEREIREELGVVVRVGEPIASVDHGYTHFSITLHAYYCTLHSGRPVAKEHAELKWVRAAELGRYAFPRADRVILEKLGIRRQK